MGEAGHLQISLARAGDSRRIHDTASQEKHHPLFAGWATENWAEIPTSRNGTGKVLHCSVPAADTPQPGPDPHSR